MNQQAVPARQIDRTREPIHRLEVNPDELVLKPAVQILDNGIPVYIVQESGSGLFRLEWVMPAGMWYEQKNLAAFFTLRMLREGTQIHDAESFAELTDYHGSYIETTAERDRASVTLYCPLHFAAEVLPLLAEMLAEPTFPEDLLLQELQHQKQAFLINQEKVSFLARNQMMAALFGATHPYGRWIDETDFDHLRREDLLAHHQSGMNLRNTYIVMAGDVPDSLMHTVNRYFGCLTGTQNAFEAPYLEQALTSTSRNIRVPKEGALQIAIRIGRRLFERSHPDFIPAQVAVTILGGYFGSRLMKKLREEQGFTYGIGASIAAMEQDGAFLVATEVGEGVAEQALDAIRQEIRRLRINPVDKEELERVSTYMTGNMLRNLDGAFARADRLRMLKESGLEMNYFLHWYQKVWSLKGEDIQKVFEVYLKEDDMICVTAG